MRTQDSCRDQQLSVFERSFIEYRNGEGEGGILEVKSWNSYFALVG